MARYPRLMPENPRLFTARVERSVRSSPSFQRVTVVGETLDDFAWNGFDHWFRLFLPPHPGAPLRLPEFSGRAWWKPYLAIPDNERPHCSNYTVAELRRTTHGVELDIDIVLHGDAAGEIAGSVAIWATTTTPGSALGLLDQGPLFDPPDDARGIHLVSDESGLPALRGILRDLPRDTTGTAIIEVPLAADVEELHAPPGIDIMWLSRDSPHAGSTARPGAAALATLSSRVTPAPEDYAFVVGESTLATEGRRALHRAGLPKSRITFSGFWKKD